MWPFYKPLGSNQTLLLRFPDINPHRFVLSVLGANTLLLMQTKCWLMFYVQFVSQVTKYQKIFNCKIILKCVTVFVCVSVWMCIRLVKSVWSSCNNLQQLNKPSNPSLLCSLVPNFEKRQKMEKSSIRLSKIESVTQSVREAGSGDWALSLKARLEKARLDSIDDVYSWGVKDDEVWWGERSSCLPECVQTICLPSSPHKQNTFCFRYIAIDALLSIILDFNVDKDTNAGLPLV